MRITRVGVWHLEDLDLAGGGIQPADRPVAITHVPDVAGAVVDDAVRMRLGRELPFLHLAGARVQASDQAGELAGPVDRPVGELERVARALPERRRNPFLEGDLYGSWHQHRFATRLRREVRGEVLGHGRALRFGHVDHRADQVLPPLLGVARGVRDRVQVVTGGAKTLHHTLGVAVGEHHDLLAAAALPTATLATLSLPVHGNRDGQAQHRYG